MSYIPIKHDNAITMSLVGGTPFWQQIEAAKYAHKIINERCAVQPGEEVLILTDTKTELEMSMSLAQAAAAAGARWNLLVQDAWMDESSPRILTDIAKKALLATDLFIDVGYSLYPDVPPEYTQMMEEKRTRRMTLECRTLRSMTGGGADCDPKVFHDIGERMRPYVEGGEGEVHCTSELGTDLRCRVKGARNINYTGLADKPGTSGCTPDGEFEIYPVLGSANGVIVADGPMNHVRESTGVYGNYPWDAYNEPLKLIVEEGKYVEAIGEGGDADKFRWLIENIPNADNFGEFAMGTNPLCRETGEFSEEKKRLGNVHVAYGRGCTPAVPCNIHLDIVLRKPRVEIDGVTIIEKGKLLI